MLRRAIATLLALFLLVQAAPASAATCWQPPAAGRMSDPFREPPCPYCAGNRGIEYDTAPGTVVRAVAAGTVTWAGVIAGVRWVVVQHVDGWRVTYGRLDASDLGVGDRILTRRIVGTTTSSFYFGLRQGERYVDPAPYLGRLVGRARLVPVDATRARPAPEPRLTCSPVGVAGARGR